MRTPMKLLPAALLVVSLAACAATRVGGAPAVDHIRLEVSNMDASVAFYRELGLQPRSLTPTFSVMEAANMDIILSGAPWGWQTPRGKDERAGWGMYPHFRVADVAETAARMEKAGYRIVQPTKEHSQFTEAFVADPDGYTWALFSWNKRR